MSTGSIFNPVEVAPGTVLLPCRQAKRPGHFGPGFLHETNNRPAFLRWAETLSVFLSRLRGAAETLGVTERQPVLRLLVEQVLVGEDTITIGHSIAIPSGPQPQKAESVSEDRPFV